MARIFVPVVGFWNFDVVETLRCILYVLARSELPSVDVKSL
jgi:hypothetical protein